MVETLRMRRVRHFAALAATPDNLLMEEAGPLAGRSVLVLGRGGTDLMGALTMAGCLDAEFLQPSRRFISGWLGTGGADIVLVPSLEPGSEPLVLAQAAAALRRARGRIVVRLPRLDRERAASVRDALAQAGFGPVTTRIRGGGRVLRADLDATRH